jgi:hypothetical protein
VVKEEVKKNTDEEKWKKLGIKIVEKNDGEKPIETKTTGGDVSTQGGIFGITGERFKFARECLMLKTPEPTVLSSSSENSDDKPGTSLNDLMSQLKSLQNKK